MISLTIDVSLLALPYLEAPEKNPHFKSFFTKAWADAVKTSLINVLQTIFHLIGIQTSLLIIFYFSALLIPY